MLTWQLQAAVLGNSVLFCESVSPCNALPPSPWNRTPDVMYVIPKLAASELGYTRLAHSLFTFVSVPLFSDTPAHLRVSRRRRVVSATAWAARSPCFTAPLLRTALGLRFRSFPLLKPLAVVLPPRPHGCTAYSCARWASGSPLPT